jgi:hypothetical protein
MNNFLAPTYLFGDIISVTGFSKVIELSLFGFKKEGEMNK